MRLVKVIVNVKIVVSVKTVALILIMMVMVKIEVTVKKRMVILTKLCLLIIPNQQPVFQNDLCCCHPIPHTPTTDLNTTFMVFET